MNANEICQRIREHGGEPWFVGGYVRDMVLGREPKDLDIVVVGMTQAQLAEAFPQHKFVGKSFPVMKIGEIEVALARTEVKTGAGHTDFTCHTDGVTLEQDLARRDLTINAMAMHPDTGEMCDPFFGAQHCHDGELRYVQSDAFREDPLRIFRVARFASQLGFRVTTPLCMMAHEMEEEVLHLPGERVFEEMMKALRSDNPRAFFDALLDMNCLHQWFPELEVLVGRPAGPTKYHPEGSAFEHTMQVIDRCRKLGGDDVAMYAALVHDLGKGVTPEDNLPHHYDHERLGVPLVRRMSRRLRAPKDLEECGVLAAREHLNVHNFGKIRSVKRVDLLQRLGRWARHVALVSMADAQGRGPDFWEKEYPSRKLVIDTIDVVESVQGVDILSPAELAGDVDGQRIADKMRTARARAVKHHFGLRK